MGQLYRWLQKKQDNIAFKVDENDQPVYMDELPKNIHDKFTS